MVAEPRPRRREHRPRLVHRYHPPHEGREGGRHLPGATAEVAHGPLLVEEAGERQQIGALPEQLAPDRVPLRGRRRKELLRPAPPLGQHAPEPLRVLGRGGPIRELGPHHLPEPPGLGLEIGGHGVAAAGAVGPRHDPAAVAQNLEVPAHGGLRELKHGAELADGKLVPVEQQEQPAPDLVGQRAEALEYWGHRPHLSIRISG